MVPKPPEIAMVEHHLHSALEAMRLADVHDLEVERVRTTVYHHVHKALETIVTRFHVAPTYPPPSQKGRGAGRGTTGLAKDRPKTGGPKTWTFAADLDLLK